jgi:hypothetical protein
MLHTVVAKYVKCDITKAKMKEIVMFEIRQKRNLYRELDRLPDDLLLSVNRIHEAELVDSVYREYGISVLEYDFFFQTYGLANDDEILEEEQRLSDQFQDLYIKIAGLKIEACSDSQSIGHPDANRS